MKDSEIIDFIKKLDAQISKKEAFAKFISYGEVALYANKEGYLRMGIELIKCAFENTYKEATLNYLFSSDTEFSIDFLAIDEDQIDFLTKSDF